MGCSFTPSWVTDDKIEDFCHDHDFDYKNKTEPIDKVKADLNLWKRSFCYGGRLFLKGLYGLFLILVLSHLFGLATLTFGWFVWWKKRGVYRDILD